jgi:hypothetical protein
VNSKLRTANVVCAAALLVAPVVAAQETAHLKVATSTSAPNAAPGKTVALLLDVTPKPKMHVYAPGQDGFITVTLTLDADPAFSTGKAKFPPAEKITIPVINETQLVYAKPFRISQNVTLAATSANKKRAADGGTIEVKGTLRYQACDDTICYRPATVPVTWAVKVSQQ